MAKRLTPVQKQAIIASSAYIADNIGIGIDILIAHMSLHNILTSNSRQMIMAQPMSTMKAALLVDIITHDGSECSWEELLKILRDNKYTELSDMLVYNANTLAAESQATGRVVVPQPVTIKAADLMIQRNVTEYSEVDDSAITEDSWMVYLVRRAKYAIGEHVFFIVTGIMNGKKCMWFMDFVNPSWFGSGNVGIDNGKIRTFSVEEGGAGNGLLLYQCHYNLMDIRSGEQIICKAFMMKRDKAQGLVTNIVNEKRNPPRYNTLGNRAIAATGSALSSSDETGHNCFTWAKEHLRRLDIPSVTEVIEQWDDMMSFLISATSRYLRSDSIVKRERQSDVGWMKNFLLMTVGAVAAVIVVFMMSFFYK